MTDNAFSTFEKAWNIVESVQGLSEHERTQAIELACKDDSELLGKVESILKTSTSAILKTGVVQQMASQALAASTKDLIEDISLGDQVGAYRLIEELGSGGMSRVYLGVREGVGFEQKVAVKIMRAFSTTRAESRARFEREQQVLATLSHPNIASIIDGGVTPSDRPFLVMEYVDGLTLNDYCREHGLDLEARLDLFTDICAAVEHAHRQLIVHRDLKPSNIMVDSSGQVKLLDFGIAKLLDDTGEKNLTRTGFMMLTPQYAAPEQVTNAPITTATDVYALGLVLYELLVEDSAWDAEGMSITEQLAHICDIEADAPSSAMPARPWSNQLRGDLDLIVAKALSKAPAERYPTCTELVRDIRCWRNGQAVSAHAPSLAYRARKRFRRHWMSITSALAFAAVVGFFVLALLQQQDATRIERDRAQEAQAATSAVNRFLVDELLGVTSLDAAYGRDVPMSLMLERAEETVGRAFSEHPALEASVRETLSRTFLRLGDVERASSNLTLAQERLSGHAPNAQSNLDGLELIKVELLLAQGEPVAAHQTATALEARLQVTAGPEHFETIVAMVMLGRTQMMLDEWELAQQSLSTALVLLEQKFPDRWRLQSEAQFDLAKVLYEQRQTPAAMELLNQRLDLQERYLGANHPDILETLRWQSNALSRLEQKQEALRVAESAYQLAQRIYGESHPEVGHTATALGRSYVRARRYDEAVSVFESALTAFESGAGTNPLDLLTARHNLGVALSYAGQLEQAEFNKREAYLGFKAHFGERHSRTRRALRNLSSTLLDRGKTEEHRAAIEQLVRIAKSFENDKQADPIQLNDAATLLLTCEPADLRDPVAALSIIRQAVERTQRKQGESLLTLGDALEANGFTDEAIRTYEEAATHNSILHLHALPRNLAKLYERTGQIERGQAFFEEHLQRRRAARGDEDWLLGITWHEEARFFVNADLGERAIPVVEKAMAQYRLTREASDPLMMRSLAVLGAAQSQVGDFEVGERNLLTAYEALLPETQVTSDVKREIITWLIQHYSTVEQSTQLEIWQKELVARQNEPLFSDWRR